MRIVILPTHFLLYGVLQNEKANLSYRIRIINNERLERTQSLCDADRRSEENSEEKVSGMQ